MRKYLKYIDNQKFASGLDQLKSQATISDNLDDFEDAGYIIGDNEIIVDIDEIDREILEAMLRIFEINTETVWTDRGVHLYFKKPKSFRTDAVKNCALGFPIEMKKTFKTNNKWRSVTIKRAGKVREIENFGIREEIPQIFSLRKNFPNLMGLGENDGRNNALFKLRGQLAGFELWRKVLHFVNDYIFDEPLPASEMDTLTREMKVTAEKDNQPEIANWLMLEYNIVYYQSQLWFQDGLRYDNSLDHLNRIIFDRVGSKPTYYVEEVIKQMKMRAPIIPDGKTFDIVFRNGILRDGKFYQVEPDEFTPYYIDIDYVEDAEPVQMVDNYLNQLTNGDEDYKKTIGEILGHCLITNQEMKRVLAKFFIFIGGGGNGKGTLLNIISQILNKDNCSYLSIKELTDERYLNNIVGKLANLGDDIEDETINNKDMKALKNLSSSDRIQVRRLYENSAPATVTATLIFTSNHLIKSFEKGESYKRRVTWLPMFTKVKKKDPLFITKLTTEKALLYWVRLMVEGYKRLYENGDFTESEQVKAYNEKYHLENNGALRYVMENDKELFLNRKPVEVYNDFLIWAEDEGVTASKKMVSEAILEFHNLQSTVKKIQGKTVRVYQEIT